MRTDTRNTPQTALTGQPSLTYSTMIHALSTLFAQHWDGLTLLEQLALIADFTEMLTDEGEEFTVSGAAVELQRRIGGALNLASYARTQVVRMRDSYSAAVRRQRHGGA